MREIVFAAQYLVLGLGDVYLGAPVATPVDPRHRLVTTKYNPARTWTAENSVGIGGAYLCIYGMEGPGGYQFVGRTTQVWNRFRRAGLFAEQPWALRFFDRIEWYPVSAEELLDLRAETEAGRGRVDVAEGCVRLRRVHAVPGGERGVHRGVPRAAVGGIRRREGALAGQWRAGPGRADGPDASDGGGDDPAAVRVPAGATGVTAPFIASVWQVDARPGMRVAKGDKLAALEAMKMETIIAAPHDGTVAEVYTAVGTQVAAGQVLLALVPDGPAGTAPAGQGRRPERPPDERRSDERRRTGNGRVRRHRRGRPARGLDHAAPGGRGPGRSGRDRRRGRRRGATAAGRPGRGRQGQHRRGRAAHHGGRALVRVPARAGRHLRRPAARRPGRS